MQTQQKSKSEIQFDKMTKTPVGKLVVSLGIPTTISMLITNVYNMADSFFVSQINLQAGGATSIVFSVMAILQAFGFMFGHGSGIHVSRALGEKDQQKARIFASTGFLCAMICGFIIMALGLIFITPLMRFLGSTETILPYAKDYALFILISAPFMTSSFVLNNILRYEGRANLAMIGLTIGGLLNIALDPMFIFWLGLGIKGAGLATAISQFVSFSILLSMFLAGKTQSKISIKYITKDIIVLKDIVVTGLPSLARQGLNSISTMVLNTSAKPFGDSAIAAIGYVARISSFIFCVGLGIGQGFQPVSGFNYGAKKYSRVKKGTYFTLGLGMVFLGALAVVCFIFSDEVIGLFRKDEEVIIIGGQMLKYYCISLLFFPISVVSTMLFQSVGKTKEAFILSCLQGGLVFIPLCLVLPKFLNLTGIQIGQPIAYVVCAVVALPIMLNFLKKLPKDQQ